MTDQTNPFVHKISLSNIQVSEFINNIEYFSCHVSRVSGLMLVIARC